MATKVTKKDNFNAIREILVDANRPDLVAVIDHELELIANKAAKRSSTPTKAQKVGAEIKAAILDVLQNKGKALRIAEIVPLLPEELEATAGKVSYQLSVLIEENRVEKVPEKRVNFYKAV